MSTQRTRSAIYRSGRLPRMAKLKGMEKNHRMAMAERSRRRQDQQTTKLQQRPSQQDVLSVKFLHLLCAGFTEQRRRGNHEELAEESQPDDKREQEEHQPEELQHEAEGQGHQKEDDDNPGESSDEEESRCEEEKNNDWEGPSCKRSRRESMGECSPVILASIDQDDKPKKKQKKSQAPSVCSSPGASPESGDSSQEQLDSFHRIYFPQPQEPLHPEAPVVGAEQPPCPDLESEVLPCSMDDALSCFPLSYPWDFDEQSYFHHHDAQNYSAHHGNSHNDADFLVVEANLQPLQMVYQQQEGDEAAAELTSFEEEFNSDGL
ncbi:hypothetical protein QOT17_005085 [Balamuthia mandrillaris]